MKMYRTSDFQAAVVLATAGYKLIRVDRNLPPRSVFEFEFQKDLPKMIESFFRDELTMNPRLILVHAKLVKDRLYASK